MRLLLAHNFYSSTIPSGENQVFELERALLEKNGHEVREFVRHSDEIRRIPVLGTIQGALAAPWNPWMARSIRKEMDNYRPDVVHVHNTFPLLSPAIFHAIGKRAARVLTLHNYRIFCPAAIPMRAGKICTDCIDNRSSIPSIIHGCYRNSRSATLPLAISVSMHRALGTWTNEVDAFITLSDFQRELMIASGLPEEKVHVKPNFYLGQDSFVPWSDRKPYVVFAGRLSAEKGVISLLHAWKAWGAEAPELRLIGDGELRTTLENMAKGLPVRFLGQLSRAETLNQIASSRLLVLASECLETFGLVVVEAFANGTPVAASSIGALPTIVQHGRNGVIFQPGNPESILYEIRNLWKAPDLLENMSLAARAEFKEKYTEEKNHSALIQIYQQALKASNNG